MRSPLNRVAAMLVAITAFLLVVAAPAHAQVYCDQTALYDASTNGATQVIAAPGVNARIWICGYVVFTGSSATNVGLVYGTGTNCGTGQTKLTPAWQLPANFGLPDNSSNFAGLMAPPAQAVCVNTSAGNPVQARISYRVF